MGKAEQRRGTFAFLVTQAGSFLRYLSLHFRILRRLFAVSSLPATDWSRCLYCEAPPTHPGNPAGKGQPIRWLPMCREHAVKHGDYWTRGRAE
jgi:hypothetical protein